MTATAEHDTAEPIDRHNPAAEEDYLVALLHTLTRTHLRDGALDAIAPEDFYSTHHGVLWAAARALRDADQRVTPRALLARIADNNAPTVVAERILNRLAAYTPPAAQFPDVLAEVRRCADFRKLLQTVERIRQRALTAEDAQQALTWATDELANLDQTDTAPEVLSYSALLDRFNHAMSNPDPAHWVIATPWPEINGEIAGGLHGGRVYVIGARPGEGKSVAAHQLAHAAAEHAHPALVFSVEMGGFEVTGRMVASGARVELDEINRRDLTTRSQHSIAEYAERARDFPLWVVDKSDVTIPYLKAVCRAQQRRTGLRVVVVDYLQLLTSVDRNKSREQQVAALSRELKVLARELDISVILAAQLNRESVRRGGKPTLADLRESGSIEADADVVILLSREVITEEGHERQGEYSGMINVDIPKNRHGRVCGHSLVFRPHYATIG